jgi:hypothetical protein
VISPPFSPSGFISLIAAGLIATAAVSDPADGAGGIRSISPGFRVSLKQWKAVWFLCPIMTGESRSTLKDYDAIQRFFIRPFFLSLTIGIPFCIYKLLFGMTALRTGTPGFVMLGAVVIAWACLDLLMNTGRSVFDLSGRPAPFEYCSIAQIGRFVHRPLVFLGIDTLLSFVIICLMLWSGWITRLSPGESALWYGATTLNLISLSLVSLYNEIKKD